MLTANVSSSDGFISRLNRHSDFGSEEKCFDLAGLGQLILLIRNSLGSAGCKQNLVPSKQDLVLFKYFNFKDI